MCFAYTHARAYIQTHKTHTQTHIEHAGIQHADIQTHEYTGGVKGKEEKKGKKGKADLEM
jgi:hypothetical protein